MKLLGTSYGHHGCQMGTSPRWIIYRELIELVIGKTRLPGSWELMKCQLVLKSKELGQERLGGEANSHQHGCRAGCWRWLQCWCSSSQRWVDSSLVQAGVALEADRESIAADVHSTMGGSCVDSKSTFSGRGLESWVDFPGRRAWQRTSQRNRSCKPIRWLKQFPGGNQASE